MDNEILIFRDFETENYSTNGSAGHRYIYKYGSNQLEDLGEGFGAGLGSVDATPSASDIGKILRLI